ncbi:MAG TPA: DUF2127 domain-containing protein [Bryobacteraceae bacterium]
MVHSLPHEPHPPPHLPQAVDQRASAAGLKTVAIFEALKGLIVVVLAIALLSVRTHIEDYAEDLLYHLNIDFDHRFAQAFLRAASKLSDARGWTVALAALTYSTVRFVEAWGLWQRRVWAEWFALLSGALYLPWELLRIAEHATWDRIAVLGVNIVIVLYMLEIRIRDVRSSSRDSAGPAES